MKKIYVILASIFFVYMPCSAGTPGTSILTFLKINPGARNASLGEINGCLSSQSALTNPSVLTKIDRTELSVQHLLYFSNINYSLVTFVYPNFKGSVYSLSLGYLGTHGLTKTLYDSSVIDGYSEQGSFTFSDTLLNFGYSHKFNQNLSFGISLKGAQEKIDAQNYSSVMISISGLYYYNSLSLSRISSQNIRYYASTNHDFYVNFGFYNIGTKIENYELPMGGFLTCGGWLNDKFLLIGELVGNLDKTNSAKAGIEYVFDEKFVGRIGYKYPFESQSLGSFPKVNITAGLGILLENLLFDYAWAPYGDLGHTHRISVTGKFGVSVLEK